MKIRILAMLLAIATPASAERVICAPVMACYGPTGKCDPPEVNTELGIFDFQDDVVLLYPPSEGDALPSEGDALRFKILAKTSGFGSTSYFTSLNARTATFTLFDNGNLAMFAAAPDNGGITVSGYFSCEDAPWKTS